jgi:hypothetical protein
MIQLFLLTYVFKELFNFEHILFSALVMINGQTKMFGEIWQHSRKHILQLWPIAALLTLDKLTLNKHSARLGQSTRAT